MHADSTHEIPRCRLNRSIILLCISLFALLPACGESERERNPRTRAAQENPPGSNVLLITLDTTRADRLGCYGYQGASTPVLDGLAARGVLFENAYSPAPMTLPAHASLLTGLLPPQHGARVNGEHRLGDDVPTLAERLSAREYRTGAFIAAFVLDHRFGLARGFDRYDDDLSGAYEQEVPSGLARYRPGNLVVDAALDWLGTGETDQPFFAWVHLYDAHYPWHAHGLAAEAGEEGSYDGEIAFVDQQVGRLLAFLDGRGLTSDTLVFAVADHGEGLQDHGEIEHAYLLNEEALRVPWIVAGPGVSQGVRIPALVTLEDFFPTATALLGLDAPGSIPGRSLTAALQGETIESGMSYAETDLPWTAYRWAPQRSLTTEKWKYIRTPMAELYDRQADRGELINLVEVKPRVRDGMEAKLAALEESLGERSSEAVSLSAEELEQLAELGYVAGGSRGDLPSDGSLADVKQRLPAKDLAARLREGIAKNALEPQQILSMADRLVQMSPETPAFHEHLGSALIRAGQVERGVAELELTVALDPNNANAHYTLGDSLQQHGQIEKARVHLEKALELEPKMAAAHVGMGNVLRSEGRSDLAAGRYTEALNLYPGYPEAHYNLALTFLDRNNPERAATHFQEALKNRPDWGLAHASLANLYANWGRADEAIASYTRAVELLPDDAGLKNDFGVVLMAMERTGEARQQFFDALRIAPEFYRPHINLGNLAFRAGRDQEALDSFQEALRLAPGGAEPTARLARFLATCPEEPLRDPDKAIALAERARDLTNAQNPKVLDTLAAAFAAAGRYPEALQAANRAQQIAKGMGNAGLAAAIEKRIALYALDTPYVEPR